MADTIIKWFAWRVFFVKPLFNQNTHLYASWSLYTLLQSLWSYIYKCFCFRLYSTCNIKGSGTYNHFKITVCRVQSQWTWTNRKGNFNKMIISGGKLAEKASFETRIMEYFEFSFGNHCWQLVFNNETLLLETPPEFFSSFSAETATKEM